MAAAALRPVDGGVRERELIRRGNRPLRSCAARNIAGTCTARGPSLHTAWLPQISTTQLDVNIPATFAVRLTGIINLAYFFPVSGPVRYGR